MKQLFTLAVIFASTFAYADNFKNAPLKDIPDEISITFGKRESCSNPHYRNGALECGPQEFVKGITCSEIQGEDYYDRWNFQHGYKTHTYLSWSVGKVSQTVMCFGLKPEATLADLKKVFGAHITIGTVTNYKKESIYPKFRYEEGVTGANAVGNCEFVSSVTDPYNKGTYLYGRNQEKLAWLSSYADGERFLTPMTPYIDAFKRVGELKGQAKGVNAKVKALFSADFGEVPLSNECNFRKAGYFVVLSSDQGEFSYEESAWNKGRFEKSEAFFQGCYVPRIYEACEAILAKQKK